MSGIYHSDRTDLIVETIVKLGPCTQTTIENVLFNNPDTIELVGKEQATKEKINSWVGVYLNRMRRKGVIQEVSLPTLPETDHPRGRLWYLVPNVCPFCGNKQSERIYP